jgi:hypothetical protein
MNLNAPVSSTNPVLDGRHIEACRSAMINLLGELRTFTRIYTERFALRPQMVVVLASTDVCAAVHIVRRGVWGYGRGQSELHIPGSEISAFLCEYPTLSPWDCEITAPGDATLGHALIHHATIAPTVRSPWRSSAVDRGVNRPACTSSRTTG